MQPFNSIDNLRLERSILSGLKYGSAGSGCTPLPRSLRRQELACTAQDELPGGEFWMGGGAVNLKLKVKTELFKKAYGVVVGDVTVTQ